MIFFCVCVCFLFSIGAEQSQETHTPASLKKDVENMEKGEIYKNKRSPESPAVLFRSRFRYREVLNLVIRF